MDPLAVLADVLQPPWRYVLMSIAVLVFAAPRAVELHASWQDFRAGRRDLEMERRRLELLKLRYEVELLRRQSSDGELDSALGGLVQFAESPLSIAPSLAGPTREPVTPPVPASPRSPAFAWLAGHPRLGAPLLWIAQVVLGLLTVLLTFITIAMPIVAFGAQDPELPPWLGVVSFVLYGLLAWGAFAAYGRTRRWRAALAHSSLRLRAGLDDAAAHV